MNKSMYNAKKEGKKDTTSIGDEGRSIIKKQVEMSRRRKQAKDLIDVAVRAFHKEAPK